MQASMRGKELCAMVLLAHTGRWWNLVVVVEVQGSRPWSTGARGHPPTSTLSSDCALSASTSRSYRLDFNNCSADTFVHSCQPRILHFGSDHAEFTAGNFQRVGAASYPKVELFGCYHSLVGWT